MNQDYERRLEAEVDRELKGLPELAAPPALGKRIMRAIEMGANLPWYQRSWQFWPKSLQVFSFIFLLLMFCGLSFAAWRLPQLPGLANALHTVAGWFAGVSVIFNALGVVLSAVVLAIKRLGVGFMFGCVAALVLGYATCFGLGTLCVRIGFARGGRL